MPRTLSAEEFKELGKRYYGKKDYQRALDAFTEGIDATLGNDIQLLDYRAATFDKLENPTAAIADSRRMIKANDKDPRGYLRAGQLLLKMKKTSHALQLYERGLRYVPVANPQYNLLRGAHDKLNRELRPPKAVDPLTQMPIEIVEMVVGHLQFYEQVVCTRVSKQWRNFLLSFPKLWTRLDLLRPDSKRSVKPSFVKTCIKASQAKVTYARLANFHDRGVLMHMATVCKSLEAIEFANCQFGFDSIMETVMMTRQLKALLLHESIDMTFYQVSQILKRRPTLETLRVLGLTRSGTAMELSWTFDLPRLKILDLRVRSPTMSRSISRPLQGPTIAQLHIANLLPRMKELKELRLVMEYFSLPQSFFPNDDIASLTKLEVLHIHNIQLGSIRLPLSLKVFDYCTEHPFAYDWHGLPALEQLHVRKFPGTPGNVIERLDSERGNEGMDVQSPPTLLKSLTLDIRHPSTKEQFAEIFEHPRLKELESLHVAGDAAAFVNDDFLEDIASKLKNLRKLKLDSAYCTGVGIRDLVIGLKDTFRELELIACDSVSPDALKWAARQGVVVHVEENRPLKSLSSRRLHG